MLIGRKGDNVIRRLDRSGSSKLGYFYKKSTNFFTTAKWEVIILRNSNFRKSLGKELVRTIPKQQRHILAFKEEK